MAEARDDGDPAAVEADDDDRRGEDRAAITLRVDYKRLNTFFADYTRNISRGGTFIRTTKPLEIGTEFVFVLTVPEPRSPLDETDEAAALEAPASAPFRLELTGQVKWVVREAEATEAEPAGMGIRFIFKDDMDRRRVEELVTDLMRTSLGSRLTDRLLARKDPA